jgi:hypothetical protein
MKSIRRAISNKRKKYRARGGQQSSVTEHEYAVRVLGEFVVLDDHPNNKDAPTYGKFKPGALEDEISFYQEYFKQRDGDIVGTPPTLTVSATKRLLDLKVLFSKMFGPNSKFSEENPLFVCNVPDEQKNNFMEALQQRLERLRSSLELETPVKLVMPNGEINIGQVAAAVEEKEPDSDEEFQKQREANRAIRDPKQKKRLGRQRGGQVDLNGLKARAKYDQARRLARLIDKLEDARGCVEEGAYGDKILSLSAVDDEKIQGLLRQFSFLVLQGYNESSDPQWLQYQGDINPKEFIKKLEQNQITRDQMVKYISQYKQIPAIILKVISTSETQDNILVKLKETEILEKLFNEITRDPIIAIEESALPYDQRIKNYIQAVVDKFNSDTVTRAECDEQIRELKDRIRGLDLTNRNLTSKLAEQTNKNARLAASASAAAVAGAVAVPTVDNEEDVKKLQEELQKNTEELASVRAALEEAKNKGKTVAASSNKSAAALQAANIALQAQLEAAVATGIQETTVAEETLSAATAKAEAAEAAKTAAEAAVEANNSSELQAALEAAKGEATQAEAARAEAAAALEEAKSRYTELQATQEQVLADTKAQHTAAITNLEAQHSQAAQATQAAQEAHQAATAQAVAQAGEAQAAAEERAQAAQTATTAAEERATAAEQALAAATEAAAAAEARATAAEARATTAEAALAAAAATQAAELEGESLAARAEADQAKTEAAQAKAAAEAAQAALTAAETAKAAAEAAQREAETQATAAKAALTTAEAAKAAAEAAKTAAEEAAQAQVAAATQAAAEDKAAAKAAAESQAAQAAEQAQAAAEAAQAAAEAALAEKTAEIKELRAQLEANGNTNGYIQAELTTKVQELETAKNTVTALTAELTAAKAAAETRNASHSVAQTASTAAQVEAQQANEELRIAKENLERELEEARGEAKQAENARAAQETRVNNLEAQLADAQKAGTKGKDNAARVLELQAELTRATEKQAQIEAKIKEKEEQAEREVNEAKAKLQEAEAMVATAITVSGIKQTRITELENNLETLEQQKDAAVVAARAAAAAAAEEQYRGVYNRSSQEIVRQLNEAKLVKDQAEARVVALNAELEATKASLEAAQAAAVPQGASSSSSSSLSEYTSNTKIDLLVNMLKKGETPTHDFFTPNESLSKLYRQMKIQESFGGNVCFLSYFVTSILNRIERTKLTYIFDVIKNKANNFLENIGESLPLVYTVIKKIDSIHNNPPDKSTIYYLDNRIVNSLLKIHSELTNQRNLDINTEILTEFNKQPYFNRDFDTNNTQNKANKFDVVFINERPAILYSKSVKDLLYTVDGKSDTVKIPDNKAHPEFKFTNPLKYTTLLAYFLVLAGYYLNKPKNACLSNYIKTTFALA